ncbi:MAG: hypothetical protein ACOYJK_07990 [Prevotella sp.]|jgi:hypothetical protein
MKFKPLPVSLCALVIALAQALPAAAQEQVKSTFNSDNVILPSSQYTPSEPYTADVWVFNENRRYEDQYYNKIWTTPDDDASGRKWYDPAYELTDGSIAWQQAKAPFSSDAYYKDQPSFQWVNVDIMGEMYMRRTFTIDKPVQRDIYLACGHDDAPSEWYINGELVHKVADGWNNDETVLLTPEQKKLIKMDGSPNVLAVHVHQNWGGAFADCGLYEADMTESKYYLAPVAFGPWSCKYYLLNYNEDLADAEAANWASPEEDESDWIAGVGPFSNDDNMFYTTEWPSQVRPILVRRHFNLTADDLQQIKDGQLQLSCSYDEDPIVYINGVKLWSAAGYNDNDYAVYVVPEEMKQQLREGDNVLAVSLRQGDGGGHIDYALALVRDYVPTSIGQAFSQVGSRVGDGRIYSTTGVYLGTNTHNLPKGVYIVDGRKAVMGN